MRTASGARDTRAGYQAEPRRLELPVAAASRRRCLIPRIGDASSGVRVAASLLWRALVAVAGLHAYWALGGTWVLHEASGGAYSEATTSLRIQSALIAILLVAACLVVRVRAGLWQASVSSRVVGVAMWVLTGALGLTAVANFAAATNWERFASGPFVLVLALLSLVVTGAGGERRRTQQPHRTLPSH
jgi:Protein of unknown function (DUF3995)